MQSEKRENIIDRAKTGSNMWHRLPEEEKDVYRDIAVQERMVYAEKFKEFLGQLTDKDKDEYFKTILYKKLRKERKRKMVEMKKFGRPKRPISAFSFFVKSSFENMDFLKPIKLDGQQLMETWKRLLDSDRDRYREDAKTDCARYFEEMSKWETDMKQIGRLDLIRKKSLYHHMATKASETDRSKDFHEPERAQVPT